MEWAAHAHSATQPHVPGPMSVIRDMDMVLDSTEGLINAQIAADASQSAVKGGHRDMITGSNARRESTPFRGHGQIKRLNNTLTSFLTTGTRRQNLYININRINSFHATPQQAAASSDAHIGCIVSTGSRFTHLCQGVPKNQQRSLCVD